MRKRWFVLFLVVTILLVVPSQAATLRAVQSTPTLTFDGTTANCRLTVTGIGEKDEVSATLRLWRGNTCLETWKDSGIGYLSMSETKTVTKGHTYKLTGEEDFDMGKRKIGASNGQITCAMKSKTMGDL